MKNKMLIVIGGLLAALLVVGVVGATSVHAQEPADVLMRGRGPGDGRGIKLGVEELEAVAEVLGMTTDEVTSALQGGKTLQDLADEAGVDIADVQAAIQAAHPIRLGSDELEAAAGALGMTTDEVTSALQSGKTLQDLADEAGVDIADVQAVIQTVHETELRDRIAQAVEDGTMTQEKADWLLEGLDKGFLGGDGFNIGFPHGRGDAPVMFAQPTK